MSINHNPEERLPLHGPNAGVQNAVTTGAPNKTNGASGAAMAVFSTDVQGNFTACNPTFAQLLGYSPQELLGRSFSALFALGERADREDQARLQRTILTAASLEGGYHSRLFAHP